MNPTDVVVCTAWEGADLAAMARLVNVAQTAVTQATIASAYLKVYDADGTQVSTTVTLTVSSVIFDTLQTGNGWTVDSTGYNFRYVITGATYFPDGGVRYTGEFVFTPSSGSPFAFVIRNTTKALISL
jgi:hypothetical protein